MSRICTSALTTVLLTLFLGVFATDATARPASSSHIGWEIDTTTYTPWAVTTLELNVRAESTEAGASETGEYTIIAQVDGRTHRRTGSKLSLRLNGASKVAVTVLDDDGARYQETVSVAGGTRTLVTMTSKWSHPGHEGFFVNGGECSTRRNQKTLRFAIRVPGDLQVGNGIEVAPGEVEAGPRLPDGEYTIWIQSQRRGTWRTKRSRMLHVRGGDYRFEVGCDGRMARR